VKGFEEVRIALNSLDLGITNAPFAQAGVNDPDYPGMNLHNYFIVRLLDLAKPGALVAVITSSRTLDSPGKHQRAQDDGGACGYGGRHPPA
jgi:hypothetical protein